MWPFINTPGGSNLQPTWNHCILSSSFYLPCPSMDDISPSNFSTSSSLCISQFGFLDLFALNFPSAISLSVDWLSLGHLLSLPSLGSLERELGTIVTIVCWHQVLSLVVGGPVGPTHC